MPIELLLDATLIRRARRAGSFSIVGLNSKIFVVQRKVAAVFSEPVTARTFKQLDPVDQALSVPHDLRVQKREKPTFAGLSRQSLQQLVQCTKRTL